MIITIPIVTEDAFGNDYVQDALVNVDNMTYCIEVDGHTWIYFTEDFGVQSTLTLKEFRRRLVSKTMLN
jgi:hypothetical protein